MFDALLNNRLLLGAVILLLLVLVPAIIVGWSHRLRDPSRPDRRQQVRPGMDRRA